MCTYFKTKTDVTQNLIDEFFFLTLTVRGPFHRKDFKWKKYGGTGLISAKTEALYVELNLRAEAASSSCSVTGDFLQYIYYVPVTKNHQNIRSRCLVHDFCFPSQIFFNDINHGYRAVILKKNSLWLLPFYLDVTAYFYYEKVRRMMHAAVVSYLLKVNFMFYYLHSPRHYPKYTLWEVIVNHYRFLSSRAYQNTY